MNFLLIPDKFKGSLTAKEVIAAISQGILEVDKSAKINSVLASDGGDGFLDAIANNIVLEEIIAHTVDPLGRAISASYLLNSKEGTAYIELAKASGLEVLQEQERTAMHTSTFGTGLQIKDAIRRGATTIYVGLGGSATNDAGIGIANALGYTFLDKNGHAISPTGDNLSKISKIEKGDDLEIIKDISFFAVNDVDNPLFGKNGAAYVYGKQKGATENQIEELDAGLRHISELAGEQLEQNNAFVPGAGAAGGTAYGLKTFCNANFISGVDFLLELAGVSAILEKGNVDYIITGEGKIDSQTINGKLVNGVVNMAKKNNIPVVAVCGKLDVNEEELQKLGIEKVMQTYDPSKGVQYSMENAALLIEELISEYFKETY